MCGIFGQVGCKAGEREPLEAMARKLAHRGPDSKGFFTAPGVGMGMVRLAIVDLESGDQPMISHDRRHIIVFNGEIYNHLDLRRDRALADYPFATRSDTETLLAAFLRYGPAILGRLNGMFAFAVWDSLEQSLFLARDRYGVKPLYLRLRPGELTFASEAKALLQGGRGVPDMDALAQYLQLGYVPSPLCAFEGLEKLGAGHYAVYDGAGLRLTRWFRPEYGNLVGFPGQDVFGELDRRMDEAVRRELLSDVPVGLFLSGGLDSSLVAAYAARHCPEMRSFALGFEESTHDESADASAVAKHLGLRHDTVRLSPGDLRTAFADVAKGLDEPFADATVLPLLVISRFARDQVKAVLTGWGGDEVFMGYPTLKAHRLAHFYRRLPFWLGKGLIPWFIRRLPVSDAYMSLEFKAKRFLAGMESRPEMQHLAWMGYFNPEEVSGVFRPEFRDRLRQPEKFLRNIVAQLRAQETPDRILELDTRLFLEGNGLFQADRMSMLASLEARVPLLNPDLSDWVNGLSWRIKMPGLCLKRLLKGLAKPRLPAEIVDKPKKGFGPPTSRWVRGPLAAEVRQTLAPDRLKSTSLLDSAAVARLLEEHQSHKVDHGRKIWALLSLQLWLENYT
jgi:asparagine synthase (glutamine-hydrolysing)